MSKQKGDIDEMLEEALDWEREHRRDSGFRPPEGLDDPIEQANDPELPDDDVTTDLPYGPDDLGRDLTKGGHFEESLESGSLRACLDVQERASAKKETAHRELPSGMNPHDLQQTGWGIIVPKGMKEIYLSALMPLLEWRMEQVEDFRVEVYDQQTPTEFLWRHLNAAPGVIDPQELPYYLLIVGGPERIPFEVQYALSINHAVGRIAFDDGEEEDFDDYTRWAEALVDAEKFGVPRSRTATILSVEDGGRATQTLASHLVTPIEERLSEFMTDWPKSSAWQVEVRRGELATKAGFRTVLGGGETPGLALVSAHGLYLQQENEHQKRFQGSFCCHPEKGQSTSQRIFHVGDLQANGGSSRSLHGLTAFLFSCYGAGTPEEDDFPQHDGKRVKTGDLGKPKRLTEQPFLAALPQQMLRQGALSVVGHVDRGWTLSFAWTLAHRYTDGVRSLEDSLKQLLRGHRIGHALRPLHRRTSALAAHLARPLDSVRRGETTDLKSLGLQWTAHHDARNFILLGDPASYLLGQRDPDRQFCCDQWTVSQSSSRPYYSRTAPGLNIPPDLRNYLEAEARAHSLSAEEWLGTILRQRMTNAPLPSRSQVVRRSPV